MPLWDSTMEIIVLRYTARAARIVRLFIPMATYLFEAAARNPKLE